MSADRDQAHAAITHAQDGVSRAGGPVYGQLAIAHALLDVAAAIREHTEAVQRPSK